MARRNQEFQTIRSEGGLLPADLLRRVLERSSNLAGTRPEDYGLPAGERLNEAITQSWNRLRRHWAEFREASANLPDNEAGTGLTNGRWNLPLLRELGFGLLPTSAGPEIEGRTYAISRFFGPVPVHLIGCGLSLDRRARGQRGAAAANPHGLVQEFLNRSDAHLWALLSNGLRLRVLRDNQALSRQSFLEFDLEAMFNGEVYSDFVLLWLVAHATRFTPREGDRPETCWLEQWTREAEEQGTRALGDLRRGVEQALAILGEGFTSHPRNTALRDALRSGQLSPTELHAQLLRLVYRLIFLFVAEDRTLEGQSLLHPRDDTEAARSARDRYAAHYSTARLREMASKIKGSRHGDLWQQFKILVRALSGEAKSETVRQQLALPALGSFLWDPASTAALNDAELTNFDLLEALRNLAFTRQGKVLRPVDYKNLGAEELGGVYESLLALTPQVSGDGARFSFAEFAGNERKTSGSYYTPDSLVQCLLDSALDPVVEEAIKGKSPADAEQAILALKVCDPAVGSGHFLVGAGHRLARHLARCRALAEGESEPSPLLYQHALRDVIGRCLYGVDVNPMAAELCRVSLWLEALEPGKPLSFLDHHIRVGNSLLGTTPELITGGLPDDAFKPIEGDDKKICTALKKRNKQERDGKQMDLGLTVVAEERAEYNTLASRSQSIDQAPDDTLEAIRRKAEQFRRLVVSPEYRHWQLVADAWCAAFVWPKTAEAPTAITTDTIRRLEENMDALDVAQRDELERLANQYQFFHWQLAFPEVFAQGGFDCVLGNPPWQALGPDRGEFFSRYIDNYRSLTKNQQDEEIDCLLSDGTIKESWKSYCSRLYITAHFGKHSGRYKLFPPGNLNKGRLNAYRLFVECALEITSRRGFCSQIVPGNFVTGTSSAWIRRLLLTKNLLRTLYVFNNMRRQWFDVSVNSVCLYVASLCGEPNGTFAARFNIDKEDISELLTIAFVLHHKDICKQSPDVFSIPWLEDERDASLTSRLYASNSAFSSPPEGYPKRLLQMELNMGVDRPLFNDRGNGVPLFEGAMIDRYDYRAKQYVSGHGSSAKWSIADWGSYDKQIRPQWYVETSKIPNKLRNRWREYRICYCDIADPSMERSVVAALVPKDSVCGDVVPSIFAAEEVQWVYLIWLAVLNSLTIDFLARKQLASKHLTMTLLDSLPMPALLVTSEEFRYLAPRVVALTCVGSEMDEYRGILKEILPSELAFIADKEGTTDPNKRAIVDAEIDAFVANRLFRVTEEDYQYIIDSFDLLARRETNELGEYRTRRLCLDAFRTLNLSELGNSMSTESISQPTTERPVAADLGSPADEAWARPMADQRAETGVQLAAILKAMTGSLPARQVRLATLLALEPRLLLPYLNDEDATSWQRLVGAEADPLPQGASAFVARNDQAWGAAVRNLRANGHLIEDIQAGTWAPGDNLDRFPPSEWADGRARMVLDVLQRHAIDTVVAALPDDLRDLVNDVAAA